MFAVVVFSSHVSILLSFMVYCINLYYLNDNNTQAIIIINYLDEKMLMVSSNNNSKKKNLCSCTYWLGCCRIHIYVVVEMGHTTLNILFGNDLHCTCTQQQ